MKHETSLTSHRCGKFGFRIGLFCCCDGHDDVVCEHQEANQIEQAADGANVEIRNQHIDGVDKRVDRRSEYRCNCPVPVCLFPAPCAPAAPHPPLAAGTLLPAVPGEPKRAYGTRSLSLNFKCRWKSPLTGSPRRRLHAVQESHSPPLETDYFYFTAAPSRGRVSLRHFLWTDSRPE